MLTFRRLRPHVVAMAATVAVLGTVTPAFANRDLVRNGRSWSVQLQGDSRSIAKRNSDVAVVDPDEIANPKSLKSKANGSKRAVLAYVSIGEAEAGRKYMKRSDKKWLTREEQGWSGNYKVRFWDEDWKNIVKSRVKAALDAGYDGVYLDRIDTYESMRAPGGSRKEMIKFVKEISSAARNRNSDAAVVVQNAEELLDDGGYVDAIDAIGKEDLLHGIHHDGKRNNAAAVKSSVSYLKKAKAKGKGVYVLEYVNGATASKVKDEVKRAGFAVSVGHRKLAEASSDD